ncbi:MAG TPA: cell filamentation protein Fic [Psychrobacter sp.]|nr:cell filamentation protein Fic [Psychrobacter sp.]
MMTKCSIDPVLRSINDLIEKGILEKSDASKRSTNYEVAL